MPYVYVNPYKASLLAAQNELQQRKSELMFVNQRIVQLEQTIGTLIPLAREGVAPTAGLPELCRQILMSQPECGFTAEDVLQRLALMGVDMNGYANPLAVLHTTLGRLVRPRSGVIKGIAAGDGRPLYVYYPAQAQLSPGEAKRMMQDLLPKPR
jgi:hypothetical protein